jgi:putative phosphoesterase
VRIGVVSDSHGDLYLLDRAINMMGELDLIIHLGDHYKDIIKVNEKYNKPIEYVVGNNDYKGTADYEKTISIKGKKIFLTHGHRYGVYYGLERLHFKALEEEADIVLYGHTHIQNIERNGDMLYINPGSTYIPRDYKPGCVVIIIDDKGEVEVNPIRINY